MLGVVLSACGNETCACLGLGFTPQGLKLQDPRLAIRQTWVIFLLEPGGLVFSRS